MISDLGRVLRMARQFSGTRLYDMSKATGLSNPRLSAIEHGDSATKEEVYCIAAALTGKTREEALDRMAADEKAGKAFSEFREKIRKQL